MNKRSAALANLSFSSSTVIFVAAFGLVMVPLYLQRMSTATYGAWLASGNIVSFLTIFESGLSTVATQRLAGAFGRRDLTAFSLIAGSSITTAMGIGIFVLVVTAVISPLIARLVHAPADQYRAITSAMTLAGAGSGLGVLHLSLGAIPQALQRTVVPGIIGLVSTCLGLIAVLLGLHLGFGVIALAFGPFTVSLTYVIGYSWQLLWLWRTLQLPRMTVSIEQVLELFRESRILLLSTLSSAVNNNSEPAIAAIFVSAEASAVLVLTGRLLTVLQMFLARIGSAVFAGVAIVASVADVDAKRRIVREIVVLTTGFMGAGLALALAFSRPVISLWVGEKLYGGNILLIILAFSTLWTARRVFLYNLTIAFGRIGRSAGLMIADTAIRLALLPFFAWLLGVRGIPMSSGTASMVTTILLSLLLCRTIRTSWKSLFLPGVRAFGASMTIGCLWLNFAPVARSWPTIAGQGILASVIMVVSMITLDPEFKVGVLHNLALIRTRLALKAVSA